MTKSTIFFLVAFATIVASGSATNEDYKKYLVFVVNGDLYACTGVLISPKHVLSSGRCVMRHQHSLKVFAGDIYHPHTPETPVNYRNVINVIYEDDLYKKLRSERIQNSFVVLTLDGDYGTENENIRITKLPHKKIITNTNGVIVGWYQNCALRSEPRIITADIAVVNQNECNLHPDEFCTRDNMTERILHSSPVLSGDTIIGFTTFGCPTHGGHAVTDVHSHLTFIKRNIV